MKHNVPYEIALKLEKAGFPGKYTRGVYEQSPHPLPDPTSDELLEVCGTSFETLKRVSFSYYAVGNDGRNYFADAPAEALAKLWLAWKETRDAESKRR
jgi:hypothetical protein